MPNFVDIARTATEICEFQYIMLVLLENVYSRPPFGGGELLIISLIVLTPKDRPWTEPRHLSHKARKKVARFELGVGKRKMDMTRQDKIGKSHKRVIFHLF